MVIVHAGRQRVAHKGTHLQGRKYFKGLGPIEFELMLVLVQL